MNNRKESVRDDAEGTKIENVLYNTWEATRERIENEWKAIEAILRPV